MAKDTEFPEERAGALDPVEIEGTMQQLDHMLGLPPGTDPGQGPENEAAGRKSAGAEMEPGNSRDNRPPQRLAIPPDDLEGALLVTSWSEQQHQQAILAVLWLIYSTDPENPAFAYRSYSTQQELAAEWLGNGVALTLTHGTGDEAFTLGWGSLNGVDSRRHNAWLRFLLNPSVKGAPGGGLNKTTLKRFARYAHERFGLRRLFMLVPSVDRVTCRMLDKLGWVNQGGLQEYSYFRGKAVTALIFSIDEAGLLELYAENSEGEDEGSGDGVEQPDGGDSEPPAEKSPAQD